MSEKRYQNKHIQAMFNVSPASVRIWASDFSEFLSPSANPPAGQTRKFTDNDMRVFATIARLKDDNLTVDEIIEELNRGVLDAAPVQVPNELMDIAGNSAVLLIIEKLDSFEERLTALETGGDTRLQKQVSDKDSEIGNLREEIGKLKALLEIERAKNSE